MIRKIKHMYRAGRCGQPMPAKVDRSVGEAALQTTVVVGLTMVVMFGLGRIGYAIDKVTGYQDEGHLRKVEHAKILLDTAKTNLAVETLKLTKEEEDEEKKGKGKGKDKKSK